LQYYNLSRRCRGKYDWLESATIWLTSSTESHKYYWLLTWQNMTDGDDLVTMTSGTRGLNKYRPHDCTTTTQHDGTVGRVHVPSCCAVAGRIPFAACVKTASKTSLCKYVFHHWYCTVIIIRHYYSEILRWCKTTTSRLTICDNGRSYLTEAWCLDPGLGHNGHQPADRTLQTPKVLCSRCAVCFYWDRVLVPHRDWNKVPGPLGYRISVTVRNVRVTVRVTDLGPVAPSSVNCTVSWLTHFTLLLLADAARELYLIGRWNRLTDG